MASIVLALEDLSCGHCIKNVEKVLTAFSGVEHVQVTLRFAKIYAKDVEVNRLIEAVTEAGYRARIA